MGQMDRCAVYRYFAATGELLYVGITVQPNVRYMTHFKSAPWPRFTSRITEIWYPTTAEAELVESEAIWAERPLFNKQHVGPLRNARLQAFLLRNQAFDVMARIRW
jgi:hypothetical protein